MRLHLECCSRTPSINRVLAKLHGPQEVGFQPCSSWPSFLILKLVWLNNSWFGQCLLAVQLNPHCESLTAGGAADWGLHSETHYAPRLQAGNGNGRGKKVLWLCTCLNHLYTIFTNISACIHRCPAYQYIVATWFYVGMVGPLVSPKWLFWRRTVTFWTNQQFYATHVAKHT